jgi:hypothetical protein
VAAARALRDGGGLLTKEVNIAGAPIAAAHAAPAELRVLAPFAVDEQHR